MINWIAIRPRAWTGQPLGTRKATGPKLVVELERSPPRMLIRRTREVGGGRKEESKGGKRPRIQKSAQGNFQMMMEPMTVWGSQVFKKANEEGNRPRETVPTDAREDTSHATVPTPKGTGTQGPSKGGRIRWM